MIHFLIADALAGADLAVKTYIDRKIDPKEPKKLCGDYILVTKATNKGFAGNRLEDEPETVGRLSAVALGLTSLLAIPVFAGKGKPVAKLGMTLLLGGAISNVADRNIRGYVVDYLQLNPDKFGGKSMGKCEKLLPEDLKVLKRELLGRCKLTNTIFNLADVMIVVGGTVIALSELVGRKQ